MPEPMSVNEFAAHAENSGGLLNLLDTSLPLERVPEGPLRELWRQLANAFEDHIEPLLDRIGNYLDTFVPQPGDEGWAEYVGLRDALDPDAIRLASIVNITPDRHGRRTMRRPHHGD